MSTIITTQINNKNLYIICIHSVRVVAAGSFFIIILNTLHFDRKRRRFVCRTRLYLLLYNTIYLCGECMVCTNKQYVRMDHSYEQLNIKRNKCGTLKYCFDSRRFADREYVDFVLAFIE